jgi:signal transduction histidine kinase
VFDFKTLTYYGVAGALSFCLSLLLFAFARYQPGTRSAKSVSFAILMLAAGYTGAAYAPSLPTWAMRLGTNMALLSAGAIMYSGYSAFCFDREPKFDRVGWAIVAATAVPFWYWGFVEPDGNYRSAVFSLAAALINGRTAVVFFQSASQRQLGAPAWFMVGHFSILTVWMCIRFVLAIVAEPQAPDARGTNPTTWSTVFAYVILITVATVTTLWLELSNPRRSSKSGVGDSTTVLGPVGRAQSKLILLWGTVIALNVALVSSLGVAFTSFFESEKVKLTQTAELTNDAFVQHTTQTTKQIDTVLHAVRGFYQRTRSLTETERFIESLHFDRSVINKLYLINSDGILAKRRNSGTQGSSAADRVDFQFHKAAGVDQINFSAVEESRSNGTMQLTVSRRIDNADQSFGGIVAATINPSAFSRYFHERFVGADMLATLVGTQDRLLRARSPEGNGESWSHAIDSPLWSLLSASPTGVYENTSSIDGVRRIFVYRQVPDLPLVMATGFSATDLMRKVTGRIQWFAVGAVVGLVAIIVLAVLLTLEIRRRDEQDRFMSMLSHELRTPLSVIRMALSGDTLAPGLRAPVQRAVGDMNDIIERTLQADRLQQGRISATPEPCNMESMVRSVVAFCSAPQRVVLNIPDRVDLHTDAQLLSVVLSNLIENGLKYGSADCEVVVSVAQSIYRGQAGVGIAVVNPPGAAGMPDPRQVFRKYYRAPAAHGKTGSGLGLHIAAGFAAKLGGRLSYVPTADKVKFELWIPL